MPRERPPARFHPLPFGVAAAISTALVLSAPFIGEIRRAILLRFPGQFVRIIGGIVLLAVAGATLAAVARIRLRDCPVWRYAALASSVIVAAGYAFATRTPDPQVNAVERFHFVEYGLVTWLFYRAWRPAGDLSTVALPALAGLLVGTIEEWFQWFIPARVGDVRDVFLNGVAIACGLLFSTAVEPLHDLHRGLTPAGRARIGALAAVLVFAFAAFFASVHVGHRISGDGWSFKSGFAAAGLDRLMEDRAARWRNTFIGRPSRLAAEDQYMTEGLWHVQRRNTAWAAGEVAVAWRENQILERYFVPVLDTPSYLSKTGHRWSADHRADAERQFRERGAAAIYESNAHASEIFVWPKPLYWITVSIVAGTLLVPWIRQRQRG